eukprot:544552-Hanusia_phi.AAC.2
MGANTLRNGGKGQEDQGERGGGGGGGASGGSIWFIPSDRFDSSSCLLKIVRQPSARSGEEKGREEESMRAGQGRRELG